MDMRTYRAAGQPAIVNTSIYLFIHFKDANILKTLTIYRLLLCFVPVVFLEPPAVMERVTLPPLSREVQPALFSSWEIIFLVGAGQN